MAVMTPFVSLSLPGLPAWHLAAAGLLVSLILCLRCFGRARRHANILFDRSPVEETLVVALADPRDPDARLFVPIERDETGPLSLRDASVAPGEKAVLRWREGAFGMAWGEEIIPTAIPAENEEIAEALADCGAKAESLDPDLAAGPPFQVDPAGFHPLPLPDPDRSTAGALLLQALGCASAALVCFACANIALDPTAPVMMVAKARSTRPDSPLAAVRVAPPSARPFTTLVPGALFFGNDWEGVYGLRVRGGFFRAPWIEAWTRVDPAELAESPAPAPNRPDDAAAAPPPPAEPAAPFIPPTAAEAGRLRRHAFGAADPVAALRLVDNLLTAGDARLALDLAESYAERFPAEPAFFDRAIRAARELGEPAHADQLASRRAALDAAGGGGE